MNALPPHSLRSRLHAGEFVLGTFVELPSPAVVEILGLAGFDFAIIDREHGSIDLEAAENLVRAAQCVGVAPIVRVAENHPVLVRQPLDMGAAGVQVPQVGSKESAEAVVRSAMFAPEGERGLQPFVRGASYRAVEPATFMASSNRDSVLAVHIEGESGAANLESILEVARIDVIFIGPYDLSQSLGVPGEVNHPKVEKRVAEIAALARAAGKRTGMFCDHPASVARWRAAGITYAALSIDATIFLNACRDLAGQIKEGS